MVRKLLVGKSTWGREGTVSVVRTDHVRLVRDVTESGLGLGGLVVASLLLNIRFELLNPPGQYIFKGGKFRSAASFGG
jgi:hypothetical protein